MSEEHAPILRLASGVVYVSGYPIVAGSFFVSLFGTRSQQEYDVLKRRHGTQPVIAFFPQYETYLTYAFTKDPSAGIFSSPPTAPNPDPTIDLAGFVRSLVGAGTERGSFNGRRLLDALLTPAIRKRADEELERAYGAGSAQSFANVFSSIISDAEHVLG